MSKNPKGGTLPPPRNSKWSQAMQRTTRVYTDQHGRKYEAVVEIKTNMPLQVRPLFVAPLYPPDKFLKVVDAVQGVVEVDYTSWIAERRAAHDRFERRRHEVAIDKFGGQAQNAIKQGDPSLRQIMGSGPDPVGQIEAARDGDPWVLGLSDERPKWADGIDKATGKQYFPREQTEYVRPWLRNGNGGQEPAAPSAQTTGQPDVLAATSENAAFTPAAALLEHFPIHKTNGRYLFSDGTVEQCESKEAAIEREQEIRANRAEAADNAEVGTGVGSGWEE